MFGLWVEDALAVVLGQPVKPVEGSVDFGIAESGLYQFTAEFILIRFRIFVGVDIGLEQVHQDVEYAFFHAWSGSLTALV